MNLNVFKTAVRTLSNNQTDYKLLASGVRHLRKCGFNEAQIFRAALSVDGGLDKGVWNDAVLTAFEKHTS